jgi:zinc transport system substrate-binding protein
MCTAVVSAKNIVVTIAPLYSLVKNVSGELNEVSLLINSRTSPHDYQLKPSDISKIRNADIVFAVGNGYESFLDKALGEKQVIELGSAQGLTLLELKGHESCHHHALMDMHVWGSPNNAKIMVKEIAQVLSETDPVNRSKYLANADHAIRRIDQMDHKLRQALKPVQARPFIVFHDGYRYFEEHYQLNNVGSVGAGHGSLRGAKTLKRIIKLIEDTKAKCVCVEPNISQHLISKLVDITRVKVAYLDIDGIASHEDAKDAYFTMMERNTEQLVRCLLD